MPLSNSIWSASKYRQLMRLLSLLILLLATTINSFADSQIIVIDLPEQSLEATLNSLNKLANIKLVYSDSLIQGLRANALKGNLTIQQALSKVLNTNGLHIETIANSLVIVKDKQSASLPKITVIGNNHYDVNSPYNETYVIPNTTTATKTDTPIMETPLNIQVISKQVLKDQQAVRMEKGLENVSGVNFVSQGASGGASLNIRGFDTLSYYRDGSRVDTMIVNTVFPDIASLEQIQVLKGPASILYGRIEPGGFVNLISKQPSLTAYNSLQQQFGSFDFYRTTIDSTGPVINTDNRLLYRFNMAYENAGSFRDNFGNDRVFIAPTAKWIISDRTQANFYLQYLHSTDVSGGALPAIGNRPANVPINLNLGENGSLFKTDDVRVAFDWSHAFNDNWTLKHNFSANLINNPNSSTSLLGLEDPNNCSTSGCNVTRMLWSAPTSNSQAYYTSVNLTGHIKSGHLLAQTLLMGWDYVNENSLQSGMASYNLATIDLYHPVYTGTAGLLNNPDLSQSWKFGEEWHGFYMQDQIKLPLHFQVLAGFRYDSATQNNTVATYINNFVPNFTPTSNYDSESVHALKPRFGLLWQPIQEISLYANYVENFGLTNGHNADGSLLAPTSAEQQEIGIKTELFDKKFMGTLAWFDLTKQNISSPNPNQGLAALGYSVTTGEVRNKGLELDLSGEVYKGIKLIGSYAYINSQITKGSYLDNNGNIISEQGNQYWGVPTHGGSLWTTYEPQNFELRGFKFGAGVVARGERQGDNANSYQLPGYAILNLMTSYSWQAGNSKISLQLNADNILDKTYANPYSSSGRFFVFANPRTFMGSIKIEF